MSIQDEQFQTWKQWFAEVSREVDFLLQSKETFWQFQDYLNENGDRVNHAAWHWFKGWCGANWGATTAVRIRALWDPDPNTKSLRVLLQKMRNHPRVFSRSRYVAITYATEPYTVSRSNREFANIAGSGEFLDVAIIESDAERLDVTLAPVKAYVDERIAHLDPGWREQAIQGNLLNDALRALREIVEKYTPLFTGEFLSGKFGHLLQFHVGQIFELAERPSPAPDA